MASLLLCGRVVLGCLAATPQAAQPQGPPAPAAAALQALTLPGKNLMYSQISINGCAISVYIDMWFWAAELHITTPTVFDTHISR